MIRGAHAHSSVTNFALCAVVFAAACATLSDSSPPSSRSKQTNRTPSQTTNTDEASRTTSTNENIAASNPANTNDVAPAVSPSASSPPQPASTPDWSGLPPEGSSSRNGDSTNNSTNNGFPDRLIIPVAGVRREDLQDTFTEARSGGRVHDAIDIIAPRGTPVVAVADGEIVKFFNSDRGGITLYQLSSDKRRVYYYAHLDRYTEDLREGHFARQGETIAYVGDTGNATPGNYHLHFSIMLISDPKRYWTGENINPYPLLTK